MSLEAVGSEMPWDEAYRLTQYLAGDPTSAVAAAVAGWRHPITREALILMDQYDQFARLHYKKPPPHPMRPFPMDVERRKIGSSGGRSDAEVISILRKHRGPSEATLPAMPSGPIGAESAEGHPDADSAGESQEPSAS